MLHRPLFKVQTTLYAGKTLREHGASGEHQSSTQDRGWMTALAKQLWQRFTLGFTLSFTLGSIQRKLDNGLTVFPYPVFDNRYQLFYTNQVNCWLTVSGQYAVLA
jgi:hypothetical protein